MPWVNMILGKAGSKEEQDDLKAGVARILQEVMAKEEQGLTVTFQAAAGFYRGGQTCLEGAVVEVRYIGRYPLDKKQEVTRRLCTLLASRLGLDPGKIIVPFSEFSSEDYGRRQGDFQ